MKRKFEVCKIELQMHQGRKMLYETTLKKELIDVVNFIEKLSLHDRKTTIARDKQVYYMKSSIIEEDIVHLHICSGKYDKQREVFDVDTDQEKGVLKKKKDAEREHNYVALKFINDNLCYCAFENNFDGIGLSKFISYINIQSEQFVKNSAEKSKFYKWQYKILVSKEFMSELEDLNRITLASIILESEELGDSEFKSSSNRSVSDEVKLVYKPSTRGGSIGSSFVKKLKKMYDSKKVLRVIAEGENDHSRVKLDTEEMKTKIEVDVKVDILGQIRWDDMRRIFTDYFDKLERGEIFEYTSGVENEDEEIQSEVI